jgi:16S rRNA (guanine966-N2)-methyltransferase
MTICRRRRRWLRVKQGFTPPELRCACSGLRILATHTNILAQRLTPTLPFVAFRSAKAHYCPEAKNDDPRILMRHQRTRDQTAVESQLRIIGGQLRGRTVHFNGDPGMRPMKERVRESVFNLVGPDVRGKTVIDLFAGTGAMAFESLSRGAETAICIERRFPNARTITDTANELGLGERITVTPGDAFIWPKRHLPKTPPAWLVFCCPPYEFFVTRRDDMLKLISLIWNEAPLESVFVVESDERFSPTDLPNPEIWDSRTYLPATISIARKRK